MLASSSKHIGKSDRVKAVDIHPSEPWVLSALYNGTVLIWNYENQLPVRSGKFIARKNWCIVGGDDLQLTVYHYHNYEKVASFEAHTDYLRAIAVHPTKPYVISAGDDLNIKLWDWDNNWQCMRTFEGHNHYVMALAINPKDGNTFASASLDKSIKIWNFNSSQPNYTLEGHEKGVCALDYYPGSDKPYLASSGDDKLVKIWDYQNKSCIQTLSSHTHNVNTVAFHPSLPLLFSGSEDHSIKIWNVGNFRQERSISYNMDRVWGIASSVGSNDIAIGTDKGVIVIQVGKEEPAISMDVSGKIIWARNNEILTSLVKPSDDPDGARLNFGAKDLGQCEIFPSKLSHSPSGRFVAVVGDGEFIIYTALAWRNKTFGKALEFVWSADSTFYAALENQNKLSIYKQFNPHKTITDTCTSIYGGPLLSYTQGSSLVFVTWEDGTLVRRMDVDARELYWSEDGQYVAIATPKDGAFVLQYRPDAVTSYIEQDIPIEDDGIEIAFEVVAELDEDISSGCWIGDVFLFVNNFNRLSYLIGSTVHPMAHLERPLYVLDYFPKTQKVYLSDKDCNLTSYEICMPLLDYQTAILRGDSEAANSLLPQIPTKYHLTLSKFLEAQGLKEKALALSSDDDQKFKIAIDLGKLDIAQAVAEKSGSRLKWELLAKAAIKAYDIPLARHALEKYQSFGDLLLLHAASMDSKSMDGLGKMSENAGVLNVAFASYFLGGKSMECVNVLLESGKYPEAAFFAKTYCPSEVSRCSSLWKEDLLKRPNSAKSAFAKSLSVSSAASPSPLGPTTSLCSATASAATNLDTFDSFIETPMSATTSAKSSPQTPLEQTFNDLAILDNDSTQWEAQIPEEPSSKKDMECFDNQSHVSMEVNTTGTGSMRGDDFDDFASTTSSKREFATIYPSEDICESTEEHSAPTAERSSRRMSDLDSEELFEPDSRLDFSEPESPTEPIFTSVREIEEKIDFSESDEDLHIPVHVPLQSGIPKKKDLYYETSKDD